MFAEERRDDRQRFVADLVTHRELAVIGHHPARRQDLPGAATDPHINNRIDGAVDDQQRLVCARQR